MMRLERDWFCCLRGSEKVEKEFYLGKVLEKTIILKIAA